MVQRAQGGTSGGREASGDTTSRARGVRAIYTRRPIGASGLSGSCTTCTSWEFSDMTLGDLQLLGQRCLRMMVRTRLRAAPD